MVKWNPNNRGSGKTYTMMREAVRIARQNRNVYVLVMNRKMATYVTDMLWKHFLTDTSPANDPYTRNFIHIITCENMNRQLEGIHIATPILLDHAVWADRLGDSDNPNPIDLVTELARFTNVQTSWIPDKPPNVS